MDKVQITGVCSNPIDGNLSLPGSTGNVSRTLVAQTGTQNNATGKSKLVGGSVRADAGDYACVGGSLFKDLGGNGAWVWWRPATSLDILRFKDGAILSLALAALSFLLAIVAGVAAYVTSQQPTANWFVAGAGAFVFGAGCIYLVLKLWNEVHQALKPS